MDLAWAGAPDNPDALGRLASLGLLTHDATRIRLTRAGRFLQNAVVSELMDYA